MSDTLQEREAQMSEHQVNRSGVCQIPGCPCRGWSVEETAIPHHEFKPYGLYCQQCGADDTAPQHQTATTTHQPAARGGGERVTVELINGVEGQCVGINDYRICGPKPWGGGSVAQSWTTDKNEVLRAFLTPDEKHAWLADDLEVVSVKQHHSLVAEREQLITALQDCIQSLSKLPDVDGAYRVTVLKSAGRLLAEIELNAHEQRSTSE